MLYHTGVTDGGDHPGMGEAAECGVGAGSCEGKFTHPSMVQQDGGSPAHPQCHGAVGSTHPCMYVA